MNQNFHSFSPVSLNTPDSICCFLQTLGVRINPAVKAFLYEAEKGNDSVSAIFKRETFFSILWMMTTLQTLSISEHEAKCQVLGKWQKGNPFADMFGKLFSFSVFFLKNKVQGEVTRDTNICFPIFILKKMNAKWFFKSKGGI